MKIETNYVYTNEKIAIITSQFNKEITDKLYHGAVERLKELNVMVSNDLHFFVPGAIEIPVVAKLCAAKHIADVIVCLGAVIRGETSHYDYVCQQVSYGCQKVAVEHEIPVIFGVLTTDTENQALERLGGKHGHKGREAIDTAMQMLHLIKQLKNTT